MDIFQFEKIFAEAAKNILLSPFYKGRRYKQFRIFLYAYLVGFVTENDMLVLFRDELDMREKIDFKALKNGHRALLRYLSSRSSGKPYLKNNGDDYSLTAAGMDALWSHCFLNQMFPEEARELFYRKKKRRTDGSDHAQSVGTSALLLFQKDACGIFIEPVVKNGARVDEENSSRACRPDAMICFPGMDIYIEADKGTEGKEALNKKIERYVNHVIWQNDKEMGFISSIYFCFDLPSMENMLRESVAGWNVYLDAIKEYHFVNCLCPESQLDLKTYFDRLKKINSSLWFSLPQFIRSTLECFANQTSEESLTDLVRNEIIMQQYNPEYESRCRLIESVVEKNSTFKKALLNGNSFVTVPVLALAEAHQRMTYYNRNNFESIRKWIIETFQCEKVYPCESKLDFANTATGEKYILKNVYRAFSDERGQFFVSFENVLDDYGAYLRVESLLLMKRGNLQNKCVVVCICKHDQKFLKLKDLESEYLKRKEDIILHFVFSNHQHIE